MGRMAATRRAQTSSESRRLLVSAAAELFAEQGFRKTTVADVADRAGISRGSIPWHFGNKDGLLEAVIEQISSSWLEQAEAPAGGTAASLDRIKTLIQEPSTRLLITLVAEAVEPGSPVHGFYADLHRSLRKWVENWTLDAPLPPGVSREEYVAVLTGAIIGVHLEWRVAPADIGLDRAFDTLKAIFIRK
ncbi:MAG: TetR/AcrR family transcriptional regulator [Actinomycetota bacterium]|nr:TetR/AcrR family transcriptional regulator [Actinomycetota bacterium]